MVFMRDPSFIESLTTPVNGLRERFTDKSCNEYENLTATESKKFSEADDASGGNGKEHLVKWMGYPDSFNSWVSDADIIDI